ncbi:MAG TPA: PAS domain S-box protein [Candidatus Acidoferrum sp.]|nr:PAS domain S-box protein [Candidatus Acidoferrum sp.]
MQRPRSSVHETSARAEDQRSRFSEIPGDQERRELSLRGVMDTIPGLVWSALPDGDVEFCNQRWLDYTGMSFNEIKGSGWAAAIHPQDLTDLRERWQTALVRSTSFEAEARMRRADGTYRWFLFQAVPLRDAGARIIRWYGTNTDVEELKLAQEELQKQTSRLDELFEQSPEAVAVVSAEDRVIRVNKEFTRMFGYEPDAVLQRPINDLIVPGGQIENSLAYTRLLKEGGRVEVETVRRRKDGTEIDVSLLAVAVRAPSGEQIVNYARYRDITERKRAEGRLRESEARFQAMADTAPVLIWMTGTDGLCNYFNKPWLEFTNRTMEQEVGMGWIEGVHPDDVQGCFDCFLPAFEARKPFTMEYRLRRADGEYRWVMESGIPRYTGGGEFTGYIGSNVDITELKSAEAERERLHQLEADLAHMNRVSMMGELAASLAHELKQPIAAALTNAKTCLRWLRRDTPDVPEGCEAALRMINDATRAGEVIDRVRSLYRRETSEREHLDLNEMIREMIVLLQDKANRTSISIRTELDPGLPVITADRVQLQQVLMNLMLNGIEAMKDANGEMTVTSKRTDGGQLLISVSDSGIGLPSGEVDRIFKAFFTTKAQGSGMGLSISRKIIESHGGRLWACANAERGATFQFTLPTDVAASSPSAA